jgi:vitamin B12 transporter
MSNRFHSIHITAVFAVIVCLAAVPGQGQQPTIQTGQPSQSFSGEVTVTATGVETEVDDAPAAVTVVTRDEMDDAQSGTVADMLRRVPGLTVIGAGDEGKLTSVFTRGTGSNQTLVLLDGVRINSPHFGGFDWSRMSTAGLRQVEVVRGPYSALWGADAVGGVINLLPRSGRGRFNGRFFGEGGSDGYKRLEADVGLGGKTFDLYASGFDHQGDGELDNSDYSSRQFLVTAGWSWGQRGSRLGVVVQDLEAETGIPFVTPGSPTANRRQGSEQTLVAVPFNLYLSDSWNFILTAAQIDGKFDFADPDDPYFTTSHTETSSTQARLASNHRFSRHILTWGGEWREDEVTDTSNLGTNLDGEISEVTSFFAQDNWQMSSKLRLLLGVRWDDADDWGSEVSPRADFGWRLSDTLELRGGYGEAFRPPSLGELYYPLSGNPDLLPETSKSTDLGMIYTTRNLGSQWQVTVFSTDLENLIEFDFQAYSNQNIGSAKIRGAELSWERSLGRRGASFMQATYLDTEDDQGLPLLRRPEWAGSWTLHGTFSDHLSGDLTVLYVGSRADIDPATFERSEAGSYTTGNIALAYSLWNGVEITGRVLNVAGKEYQEVLGYPAPGRRYIFGLRLGVDKRSRWQRP